MNGAARHVPPLPSGSVVHVHIGRVVVDGALATAARPDIGALQAAIAQRLARGAHATSAMPPATAGASWLDAVSDTVARTVTAQVSARQPVVTPRDGGRDA